MWSFGSQSTSWTGVLKCLVSGKAYNKCGDTMMGDAASSCRVQSVLGKET